MILLASGALAASLSGFVHGADGAPLAGVDVVAYDARLAYASARSTNDGAFTIARLPPGRYRLRALPADTDPHVDRFLPDEWDFCASEPVALGDADDADGLTFALPEGARLTGRILAADGAPPPGLELVAIGQSERSSLVGREGVVEDDGTFTIVGLDGDDDFPEPYAVYLAASGWPRQYLGPAYRDDDAATFDVLPGQETDAGEHILLDGITVTGEVRGPDGPVGSGTVYVYSSSQVLSVAVEADGTYVADGLPPGEVVPWAASPGLATTYYPNADRPGERIPAPDEGALVESADLDLPFESTLTVTIAGEGDLSDVSVLLYNDTYTVGRGSPVSEDGVVTLDALHPGTYFLYVYGADVGLTDDFARGDDGEPLPIRVDGATDAAVSPPRGASFSGVVRDETGVPVYGAYVYATTADGEDTEVAVTDDGGVYAIVGLVGGEYTLRVAYAHYCPSDAGFTPVWWPEARVAADALVTRIATGELRADVDFTIFRDDDHDGMGDAWEAENGLDPGHDDAGEDPDGDGYLNIEEWALGTDPTGGGSTGPGDCGSGCGSGGAALTLLLPLAVRRRRAACTGAPRSRALRW